jgi:hypothetical protein
MKAYFLNVPNEEKENILNQHKNIYDGYVTNYAKPHEQPLYVQDFANDKNGITVSNKGVVKRYTNMGINENMDEMELDMIGDGPTDFEAGVFDEEMFEEDEMGIDLEKDEKPSYDIDVEFTDDVNEEDSEMVKDNVQESLNWFKRFTKYN